MEQYSAVCANALGHASYAQEYKLEGVNLAIKILEWIGPRAPRS